MPRAALLLLTIAVGAAALAAVSYPAIAASLGITSANLTADGRTYGAPITCSLSSVADTFVRSDAPTSPHGGEVTATVSSASAATARALLRFDLTGCSPAIAAGAVVHAATLRVTLSAEAATERSYDLRAATEAWDEATVHWDGQPLVSAGTVASVQIAAGTPASTVIEWNVVAAVQDLVNGTTTNHGWRMHDAAEGSAPDGSIEFHAREAGSGVPQLVITYAD